MKFCIYCGRQIEEDNIICFDCARKNNCKNDNFINRKDLISKIEKCRFVVLFSIIITVIIDIFIIFVTITALMQGPISHIYTPLYESEVINFFDKFGFYPIAIIVSIPILIAEKTLHSALSKCLTKTQFNYDSATTDCLFEKINTTALKILSVISIFTLSIVFLPFLIMDILAVKHLKAFYSNFRLKNKK